MEILKSVKLVAGSIGGVLAAAAGLFLWGRASGKRNAAADESRETLKAAEQAHNWQADLTGETDEELDKRNAHWLRK